jgi:hypothetical protein
MLGAEPRGLGRRVLNKLAPLDLGWLVVFIAHCAIFGGILVYSDFLPYTFDNNESFSAFWHARNLYEYGFANTSGLADESFSYDASAHPYVYTHAGASPRLFAYLLYLVGIRTIEAQIAITVLGVGLFSFWLAYRFLAEVATRFYAMVACLLLMTDYLMFAQWHFVAWQVWKMFFLFGGLYLAHRMATKRLPRPLLAMYAFHACLFYYETIFNVYVALVVFLYFIFATRDYRSAFKLGMAQFLGALTAAVILLAQCITQFGWDVVLTDAYYTFVGRNYATDVVAFREAAKAFYANHNIVFWMNIPDIAQYRNVPWALRILFQDFSVHTPIWSFVVLAFVAAELIRRFREVRGLPPAPESANKLGAVSAVFVLGALIAALFGILARNPEVGAGLAPLSPFWTSPSWLILIFGGGALFALPVDFAPRSALFLVNVKRILGASVFVAALLAFLLTHRHLYTPALEPIWRAALVSFAGHTRGAALFITAMVALAAWHAVGSSVPVGRTKHISHRLLLAIAAMLVAFLLVYLAFTGYVYTGYFARYAPFTVYVTDLILAVGLMAMIDCVRSLYGSFSQSTSWRRMVRGGATFAAAFGLAGTLLYWGILQAFLFRKLPPDTISFLPVLSAPPFRGSTFTGTFYGATVAYFTKNWAYPDYYSLVGNGQVTLGPDGYRMERDYTYVWFADRAVNQAYVKPEYYLAMTFKSLALPYLTGRTAERPPRAGDIPLVSAARAGRTGYLRPVEVARDPSPRDRWSIVRLDWDFPPFLRPIEGGETVGVEVSPTAAGTRIRVSYQYAHQESVPEAGTRVDLFAHPRCGDSEQSISVAPAATSAREFVLPRTFAGTVHAEVRPATATKVGPAYGSQAIRIGSVAACPRS